MVDVASKGNRILRASFRVGISTTPSTSDIRQWNMKIHLNFVEDFIISIFIIRRLECTAIFESMARSHDGCLPTLLAKISFPIAYQRECARISFIDELSCQILLFNLQLRSNS